MQLQNHRTTPGELCNKPDSLLHSQRPQSPALLQKQACWRMCHLLVVHAGLVARHRAWMGPQCLGCCPPACTEHLLDTHAIRSIVQRLSRRGIQWH